MDGLDGAVVVFVAHGSRATAANDAHRAQAEALSARTGATVHPAFLELAEPSIPEAIDEAVAAGASHLRVLPYFLYPGRHMTRDIPALIADATRRHPDVTIDLLAEFGADDAVLAVLEGQVAVDR